MTHGWSRTGRGTTNDTSPPCPPSPLVERGNEARLVPYREGNDERHLTPLPPSPLVERGNDARLAGGDARPTR
jgi:hypothetical protein